MGGGKERVGLLVQGIVRHEGGVAGLFVYNLYSARKVARVKKFTRGKREPWQQLVTPRNAYIGIEVFRAHALPLGPNPVNLSVVKEEDWVVRRASGAHRATHDAVHRIIQARTMFQAIPEGVEIGS